MWFNFESTGSVTESVHLVRWGTGLEIWSSSPTLTTNWILTKVVPQAQLLGCPCT